MFLAGWCDTIRIASSILDIVKAVIIHHNDISPKGHHHHLWRLWWCRRLVMHLNPQSFLSNLRLPGFSNPTQQNIWWWTLNRRKKIDFDGWNIFCQMVIQSIFCLFVTLIKRLKGHKSQIQIQILNGHSLTDPPTHLPRLGTELPEQLKKRERKKLQKFV